MENAAVAVDGQLIVSLGSRAELVQQFPEAIVRDLGNRRSFPA